MQYSKKYEKMTMQPECWGKSLQVWKKIEAKGSEVIFSAEKLGISNEKIIGIIEKSISFEPFEAQRKNGEY